MLVLMAHRRPREFPSPQPPMPPMRSTIGIASVTSDVNAFIEFTYVNYGHVARVRAMPGTFRAISRARASSRPEYPFVLIRDRVRVTCNTKLTGLVTRLQPARSLGSLDADVICESRSSISLAFPDSDEPRASSSIFSS
jgi:hypothetical protein